ncbi:SURF1 family protein [Mycolicibacterium brumae]|uniref:SURF1-like protein n=1 Tax=Mycolicibacterium brumae TaxID=85968 RepID=A0A2G5P614_9MYCO|nr:SURF1 family protein [Mycolicibacterium brumae]PIB73735.1 SURF1 family protein [Mycolicibacterium brumae]
MAKDPDRRHRSAPEFAGAARDALTDGATARTAVATAQTASPDRPTARRGSVSGVRKLVFRPSWLVLAAVVALFAYLCFTVLAPWQLGKNARVSKENQQINASLKADPVPVTSLLPEQDSAAPDDQWRRVTATGHYLPDQQVLARLRVLDGGPVFEVLVPFQVDDGPTVLVDRGWVPPMEGSRPPAFDPAPSGTVTINARLRDGETAPPGKAPFTADGALQVYAIDTTEIAELTGSPLTGSYLQLEANQPGSLGDLGVPNLDAGPFLSYGIQWIAFGVLAPIGLGYFIWSEIKVRRKEKELQAAAEADDSPSPVDGVDSAAETAVAQTSRPDVDDSTREATIEQKLTDRYGRRR